MFPKATRTTIYSATAKKSVPALKGIGFVATRPSSDPVPTQYPPQQTVTQQDFRPTRPSFSNFEQNQEILEKTETDIENLADNFVLKTVEPAKTGSGGSESLDINVSMGGTGAETGSGDAETGSGRVEKPIAPSEPKAEPTEPTAQSVLQIAPLEPTEPPVVPIAPPESVAGQKPEKKTDDQVVAEKKRHQEFSIGDRVVIVEDSIHNGQRGEIIAEWTGSREIDYQIKLDKASHNQPVVIVHVPKGPHAIRFS